MFDKDDINNPLEQLKVEQALRSEMMKLEYRKKNKSSEINILDYTVIEALKVQKADKVKSVEIGGYKMYGCPRCDYTSTLWSLQKRDKHCPECGKSLLWED